MNEGILSVNFLKVLKYFDPNISQKKSQGTKLWMQYYLESYKEVS